MQGLASETSAQRSGYPIVARPWINMHNRGGAVCLCLYVLTPPGVLGLSVSFYHFPLFFLVLVILFILCLSRRCYFPALRGARGFGFPSWVRRFLPFLISWRCFHFLLAGRTAGTRGGAAFPRAATVLSPWSLPAFFRAQTCSQIWSTVLRLGWSTSCMKSRYQSFWLVIGGPPPLRGSNRTGASEGRLETEDVEGTTSKVMPSKVCVKPCSMAWHW